MKRANDYGRITITVPFTLQQRMRQVRGGVNWSAIACDAFEKRIEELEVVENISSIVGTIARMKKLASANESICTDGTVAGTHWAMNMAMP